LLHSFVVPGTEVKKNFCPSDFVAKMPAAKSSRYEVGRVSGYNPPGGSMTDMRGKSRELLP
jgi:hypothetical protein